MGFLRTVYSEWLKLFNSRGWWIVFGLVLLLQPLLGLLEANQLVSIGLDATPATYPDLLEAIPPLDYFGFDTALFGLLPIVIWGGINGASEYKHHNLRTTVLSNNKRVELFFAKLLVMVVSTALVGLLSIYITVGITHVGLGELGLNPISLSRVAWNFIGYTGLNWMLVTILSFSIGVLCKNVIIPLVFLVPQIYNLGDYLAQRWSWGAYLPVAAGNLIIATPVKSYPHDPMKGITILLVWIIITLLIAFYSFIHSDIGGEY